jgi:hypothetical protein
MDTQIESPASYQGSATVVAPTAGGTIQFQLFVPTAAGGVTLGFNLELSASGLDFLQSFAISGTDFLGAPLVVTQGEPIASAILIARPTYPGSGYIATVTLTALLDIPVGTVVSLTNQTSIADANSGQDFLDVTQASLTLVDAVFVDAIPGDLNLDGSVDFSDFLTFASNFGLSGPAPSPSRTQTVIRRDTILVAGAASVDTVFVGGPTERLPIQEWSDLTDYFHSTVYWLGVLDDRTQSSGARFIGTGFAVETDLLATNFHVASAASSLMATAKSAGFDPAFIAVRSRGRASVALDVFYLSVSSETGSSLGFTHPLYSGTSSPDLAVLPLSPVLETKVFPAIAALVPFKEAKELKVGDEIATVGFPGELEFFATLQNTTPNATFKSGSVSALRPYDPAATSTGMLVSITDKFVQHNFGVTPGTSGSPIFNHRSEVVAINNSVILDETSLGFAIRADELRELLQALSIAFGKPDLLNSQKAALPPGR